LRRGDFEVRRSPVSFRVFTQGRESLVVHGPNSHEVGGADLAIFS